VTAGAIAVLALSPLPAQSGPEGVDKLQHLAAFAVLAAFAEGAYPGRHNRFARWGLLLAYGLLIEASQAFLPYRDASWADLIANAFGVLGYTLAAAGLRFWVAGRAGNTAAAQSRAE
jgi:VanZ family protein